MAPLQAHVACRPAAGVCDRARGDKHKRRCDRWAVCVWHLLLYRPREARTRPSLRSSPFTSFLRCDPDSVLSVLSVGTSSLHRKVVVAEHLASAAYVASTGCRPRRRRAERRAPPRTPAPCIRPSSERADDSRRTRSKRPPFSGSPIAPPSAMHSRNSAASTPRRSPRNRLDEQRIGVHRRQRPAGRREREKRRGLRRLV